MFGKQDRDLMSITVSLEHMCPLSAGCGLCSGSQRPCVGRLAEFGLGGACRLHQAEARKKIGFSLTPFLLDSLAACVSVVRAFKVPESHHFPYGFEKFFKRRRNTELEMQQLIKQLVKGTI